MEDTDKETVAQQTEQKEQIESRGEESRNEIAVATQFQEMTSSERTQSFHQCLIPTTCLADKLVASATSNSTNSVTNRLFRANPLGASSCENLTTTSELKFSNASGNFATSSGHNNTGLGHQFGLESFNQSQLNNNNTINNHKITDNHLSAKLNRSSAAPYTLTRSNSATSASLGSSQRLPVRDDSSSSNVPTLSSVLLTLEKSGVNIGMFDHLLLNNPSALNGSSDLRETSIQVAAKLIEQSIRAQQQQQLKQSQENPDCLRTSFSAHQSNCEENSRALYQEQIRKGITANGDLSDKDDILMTCPSETFNSRGVTAYDRLPNNNSHNSNSNPKEDSYNNCEGLPGQTSSSSGTSVEGLISNTYSSNSSPPLTFSPNSSSDCNNMSINSIVAGLGLNMVGPNITTSPGGSLDEHDCDEDKVINGDTFSPGDVPDPDAIKMFVGQIPKNLSETQLKTLFEEFGRVFQINVLRDKVTKQSKGCCFVTFYTRKAALDAQNALHNVKTLPGMNHPIQMKPADNENRYERKLFVGMLSKKCNESDVRNMFSRFGHIDECTVLRDLHGQSRGCAFITFASKQCAQSAIKGVHHSITMEGCTSPIVVKFADTQKDKDQKRNQQYQGSMVGNFTTQANPLNPIAPQYFSELLVQEILQQIQQQQQSNNYFSQLNPLGVQGIASLASLTSPNPAAALAGLTASHSSNATNDLATLAALANFSGVSANQHSMVLGVQAALAAAMGGNHTALSPAGASNGANGLGSTGNSLASLATGNGLHSGFNAYTNALRTSVASKQAEGPEGANLFIYHLPPEWGDADLVSMFSNYGNVISAKVFIDKNTNLSKCFGFVSYDNGVSAQVAIQSMNGFQVGMKRLKVQLKRSKDAAKPY